MSVKIRIAVLVVLLLSVMGVTAVSASSSMPAPDIGNIHPEDCQGCHLDYYGWWCVTALTQVGQGSDVGDINWYDYCVWNYYANCRYNVCFCEGLGDSDYCYYGFE